MGTIFTHHFRHDICKELQERYKACYCRRLGQGKKCGESHRNQVFRLIKELDVRMSIPYIFLPYNAVVVQDIIEEIRYMLQAMEP